jgi:glycosyltransferase involved in cell wall biosynthesis
MQDPGPVASVVMPCLNEENTLAACVAAARRGIDAAGIAGEVIVVDNGSTDSSVAVAEAAGARVVQCDRRGYGNALRAGFAAARGRFILMGDADLS